MFLNGKNPNMLIETMNIEMDKVITWLKTNKLSLNLKKTHYIIFRKGRRNVMLQKDLVIDNIKIENVKHSKFLGVIIDQRLTFYNHIQYMKGKISRAMGILYKCRKYLKQSTLLTLYNAFIYPYFNYCIAVWGKTCNAYLAPLIKLQKRAVRIISNADRYESTAPIFKQLNILNLSKLHIYFVQLFVYKYICEDEKRKLPAIFEKFFTQNSSVHQHFTRQINQLHTMNPRCNITKNGVRCFGVKSFNYYLNRVRMNCEYNTYKSNLKYHLINNDVPL